jgi:hypothetical protein
MILTATAGPTAYWYLTRGTGLVALVLLTLSVALGVANVRRVRTEHVPRFVFDAVHRSVSLLAVAFTAVHIVTSLLDGFAPIRLVDVIVPFGSPYRPLWVGLGAVAFDLLIAVTITSLLRRRLGHRTWRLTHWAAYASWPVALLHGLGTGSDVKLDWALAIMGGCAIVVIVAVVARATAGWPDRIGTRVSALAAAALVPLGLLIWLPSGPLAAGWAKRAGTPSYLLARSSTSGTASTAHGANATESPSFTAQLSGSIRQGESGRLAVVDITMAVAGQQLNQLHIRLTGEPLEGGGVQMTSSRVTLGTNSNPEKYRGTITALQGTNVAAGLHGANGSTIRLVAQLQRNPAGGSTVGTVTVGPGR